MFSLSDIDERSRDGLMDLRALSPEDQGAVLRHLEHEARARNVIDGHVYMLSSRARHVLDRMGEIEFGMHDLDGTHTSIGGHRLHTESLDGLDRTRLSGMRNVALTGRHEWQVRELMQNHPFAKPFEQYLIEQGFYRINGKGQLELFEGSPAIEHLVTQVRNHFDPLLGEIGNRHGVAFETTSLRGEGDVAYPAAHQTMYSIDAMEGGRKIADQAKHERIFAELAGRWAERDPENSIATLRTSSTGTFEFTPDGVNKEGAARSLLNEQGVRERDAAYFGDSSNDLPVFQGMPDLGGKFAIVNPHTKDELIGNADLATVGINAGPILRRLAMAREAAKKIVVP